MLQEHVRGEISKMNNQINAAGEQLEDAFQIFNQFSEKLADSYSGLESQIVQLTKELAEARSERLIQLAEKEVLAKSLASLFDALPAGIVVLDSEGRIKQTNPIARQMMNLKSGTCKFNACKWEDIASDIFISDGDELRLRDGRWVNVSACPLENDPGKIILISDVSETHTLQNMLNQQQRLSSLGEMVASLAHQIRTPLSSALLYISNMNHPETNEKKKRCFSEKVRERLYHLQRMVDDMLIFARGDISQSEYINAAELFTQLKNILEHDYKFQKIVLDINSNLKNIIVRTNADVLLSAIQNIIDNAIEACGELSEIESEIEIRALLNNKNLFEINIKDNGCGMSEEIKERVLEPFFTTRSNGTGLGLAVVNATVSRYGGNMNIVSTQGMGSEINITMPRVEVDVMLPSNLTNTDVKMKPVDLHTKFSQSSKKTKLKLIDCREAEL